MFIIWYGFGWNKLKWYTKNFTVAYIKKWSQCKDRR